MDALTIGDIFNNVMRFINIIEDSKSIMFTSKTIYKLVKENELFQHYMQLLKSPKIEPHNISNETPQYYFMKACFCGNFLCKNIIENNKIDIYADDDLAFQWCCTNGHLEVAKWLVELSQSEGFSLIDIHLENEYAFQWSCKRGYLEVARWLIELSQSEGFTPISKEIINEYLKN